MPEIEDPKAPSPEAPAESKHVQRPSVGRIVDFWPLEVLGGSEGGSVKGQPLPAIVTHVWGTYCVNLHIFSDGSFPMESLSHGGGMTPTSVSRCDIPTGGCWSWPKKA